MQGFGLGLRPTHYPDFKGPHTKIKWLEAVTDNYLVPGGIPLYHLSKIREIYPMAIHGVAMNIGSYDPIDQQYLKQVKALMQKIKPALISDHLCWTGVGGRKMHDLYPMPYTQESIEHVVKRISMIQDFLGCELVLENVSTYVNSPGELKEWEYIKEIAQLSGCGLLVDLNNIYVNSRNYQFNPIEYLNGLPANKIRQLHLAGHSDMGDFCIDTHDKEVSNAVWQLYKVSLELWGEKIPCMIERDDDIPQLDVLVSEIEVGEQLVKAFHLQMELEDATH